MTGRSRSDLRSRSPYRAGSLWSPAALQPYAWYDAHLGGSTSGITDSSGNGRADMTNAAGANAALFLPYTVPSVHLESASTGTNSISCTAPSGTASYSAVPRDGGAPTTGAASAGAFAFTTAGDWASISLLNAGATELARFSAASSGQTGHTDTYGVAWTVNRGTVGRKSVTQSAAADSAESLFLVGPNDWLLVPLASLPPMTAGATSSAILISRQWDTQDGSFDLVFWAGGYSTSEAGACIRWNGIAYTSDGAGNTAAASPPGSSVSGRRDANGYVLAPTNITATRNTTLGTPATASSVGNRTPAAAARVGADGALSYASDSEFRALVLLDRAVTAAELAAVCSYYRTG